MRTFSVFSPICALAFITCIAEDIAPACDATAAVDSGDDHCSMLQGSVVSQREEDRHTKMEMDHHADATGKHDAHASKVAKDDSKGFPNIFKKITHTIKNMIGGTEKLEHDLDGIKKAVDKFEADIHTAATELQKNVQPSAKIDHVVKQVQAFDRKCRTAAIKLWEALAKVTTDFMSSVGKIVPAKFKSALKKNLDHTTGEAKHFANSFTHDADALSKANLTQALICKKVSHQLHAMKQTVEKLIASAKSLTSKGLHEDLAKVKASLPDAIKKKVDEILQKTHDSMNQFVSKLSPTVQDISHNVAKAFTGHCLASDLGSDHKKKSASSRTQVSLLSALATGALMLRA